MSLRVLQGTLASYNGINLLIYEIIKHTIDLNLLFQNGHCELNSGHFFEAAKKSICFSL